MGYDFCQIIDGKLFITPMENELAKKIVSLTFSLVNGGIVIGDSPGFLCEIG